MCLAIPGKVIKIEDFEGEKKFTIDYTAEKREVNLSAVDVKVGDYVIVSNKIIITKVSSERAKQYYKLLKEDGNNDS